MEPSIRSSVTNSWTASGGAEWASVAVSIQPAAGGGFQINGMGSTNLTYTVWASTNLTTTNWMAIGSVMVPANTNVFQFTDTNTMYYVDRFYRFTWP